MGNPGRGEVLHQAGLTPGAVPCAAIAESVPLHAPQEQTAPDSIQTDWAAVRSQFPLTTSYIHLATFLLSSHPRPVAEAIERHRRAFDENAAAYYYDNFYIQDAQRRAVAAEYMGGSADHIALTDSTTMGLGLVYGGLKLKPEQEVVTTTHDHYSTLMALRHRAERTGAVVRQVPLYADPSRASVQEVVERMREAITERTRAVAVTWVHSSTGVKLPLAAMADTLGEINAKRALEDQVLFCVDGVHGFGVENVTIDQLGCDFFIAGTHKWICGPRGTGVIWGKPDAWKQTSALIPSFAPDHREHLSARTLDHAPVGALMTPGGFHSFEHRWALDEAFRFHLHIGKDRIHKRIHTLSTIAKEAMLDMPHIKLHTPLSTDLSAGIICFEVSGYTPAEVVNRLRLRNIIASQSPYHVSYARIAPGIVNNENEIECTLRELHALA